MPLISTFEWYLWLAATVGESALLGYLLRAGRWRRWPSLFAYLFVITAQCLLLMAITQFVADPDLQPALYFWLYWATEFLAKSIQIWMMIQVCSSLLGVSAHFRRAICFTVPAITLVWLCITLPLSLRSTMPLYGVTVTAITAYDKAVSLACLLTFLAIAGSSEFFGIEWPRSSRFVALGFAVESGESAAVSWLSDFLHGSPTLNNAKGLAYLCALLLWAVALDKKNLAPEPQPDPTMLNALLQACELSAETTQRSQQ